METVPPGLPQPPGMGAAEFYHTLGRLEARYTHVKEWLGRLGRDIGDGPRLADLEVEQAQAEEQHERLIEYVNRWLRNDFEVNYALGRIKAGQTYATERIARLKRKKPTSNSRNSDSRLHA